MAADLTTVRQNYVLGMQRVAKLLLQLNAAMSDLSNLYNGAGLSGTFLDAELSGSAATKHLVAADVGTYTANLNTVQAAITGPILNNMGKAVGAPVGGVT
jgi:hypothetical protein